MYSFVIGKAENLQGEFPKIWREIPNIQGLVDLIGGDVSEKKRIFWVLERPEILDKCGIFDQLVFDSKKNAWCVESHNKDETLRTVRRLLLNHV